MAEKSAEQVKGPQNKAMVWRNIAWAYYDMRKADEKNLERCRRAIEKSLQNAKRFPTAWEVLLGAVALASAANLYLELGEIDLAKQTVKRPVPSISTPICLAASAASQPRRCSSSSSCVPVTSTRQGNRRKTAESGRKQKADARLQEWQTSPGWPGQPLAPWKERPPTSNACSKRQTAPARRQSFARGVAAGLLELQQQAVNKKP